MFLNPSLMCAYSLSPLLLLPSSLEFQGNDEQRVDNHWTMASGVPEHMASMLREKRWG